MDGPKNTCRMQREKMGADGNLRKYAFKDGFSIGKWEWCDSVGLGGGVDLDLLRLMCRLIKIGGGCLGRLAGIVQRMTEM